MWAWCQLRPLRAARPARERRRCLVSHDPLAVRGWPRTCAKSNIAMKISHRFGVLHSSDGTVSARQRWYQCALANTTTCSAMDSSNSK